MYPYIHLHDGLELPTFFLVISLVISISLFWVSKRAPLYHIPVQKVLDLSLILMVSSLVGSRLFHVIYENPEYYLESPRKIFFLWDGGFVFFGGAFFAFVSAWLFLRITKVKNRGDYFDLFAPVLSFAYGFGRLGCFLAGCCYGETCALPWAIDGRHPTQLYAFFWELGVLMLLLGLEKTPQDNRPSFLNRFLKRPGDLFLLWVALHSIGRLIMESFRDDFRGHDVFGLSISSFFSVVLILIVILIFARKRHSHGTN